MKIRRISYVLGWTTEEFMQGLPGDVIYAIEYYKSTRAVDVSELPSPFSQRLRHPFQLCRLRSAEPDC